MLARSHPLTTPPDKDCAPDVFQDRGITALLTGLATSSSPTTPKFYIHTSGAARIWYLPPTPPPTFH